ncbi:hypothetical protein [Kordia sp.]|uniref:hypothetical protein n=1 Tax=Kordia sp. TaxID=1965332 RepID=UPI003D29B2A5
MEKKYETLIGVLGWEDRFHDGIKLDIESYNFEKITLIRYTEYNRLTLSSRKKVEQICENENITLSYIDISVSDTVLKWKQLEEYFLNNDYCLKNILLEISTMPRDTTWALLYFLNSKECNIDYVYHQPNKYNPNWLSKEPGKPRLLFKHSGISKLGAQTALIIITGFEVERAKQLVYFFEPKITYLGLQKGEQFNNKERNVKMHDSIKGFTEVVEFSIDAYGEGSGYLEIKEQIEKIYNEYNVIITSLGPKLTSMSIYKIYLEFPEIALSYVPSKEFNTEYSIGIGEKYYGSFN